MHPLIVFLDCEFTDFIQIDLISIALVSSDGREFYAERSDFMTADCSDFTKAAVLPLLDGSSALMSREELMQRLRGWLDSLPEFAIACDSNHDRDLFVDAVGYEPVTNLVGWINLKTLTASESLTFQREVARYHNQPSCPWHHALHDARAHRTAWMAVKLSQ